MRSRHRRYRRADTTPGTTVHRPASPLPPEPPEVAPDRRAGLGGLDDLVVPFLQWGARRAAHAAEGPLRVAARWEERVAHGRAYRWLRRRARVVLLVTTLIAFTGSAVHLQRYPRLQEERRAAAEAAREQTIRPVGQPRGDALAGGGQITGPIVGARVEDHVEARRAVLLAAPADDERYAVVSFDGYLTAEEALAALPDGVEVLEAQVRIPDVNAVPLQTEVVAGDLVGSVARVLEQERTVLLEEIAGLREYVESGSVTDEAFLEAFQADLDRAVAVRNLLDSGAGTVFALVVRAEVADLRVLDGHGEVRLVDLAPGETDLASSVFFGLRPEDVDRVTYGAVA